MTKRSSVNRSSTRLFCHIWLKRTSRSCWRMEFREPTITNFVSERSTVHGIMCLQCLQNILSTILRNIHVVVTLCGLRAAFVSSGYYVSSLATPMWEITFSEDNTLHVAIARGNNVVDITHAMLTDGNRSTIVRLGRATNVSNLLQTTPGCGVAHTPEPCSMRKVESQNFSSTVSSSTKFRSSQGFVVTHSSKTTANPWHMPIEMVFWQVLVLAQCGNGVLDSPVTFLNSAKCQVTDSSQRVQAKHNHACCFST